MRAYASLGLTIIAIAGALLLARGNASAATASLELVESGPAISFQWYYTVTLSPGDSACPATPPQLKLTWDTAHDLGSVPLDCETLTASGVVLPPAAANAPGAHTFCVGGSTALTPRKCATFEIKPAGAATPFSSPPECSGSACPTAYPTFEPDCIPTGQPRSPLCVTVTPQPYCDDGSNTLNSPPCADAMTSTPTAEPSATPEPFTPTPPPDPCDAPGTPAPSCTTPSPSPSPTRTPSHTPTPSCPTTAADATPAACATLTSGSDQSSGGRGLRVKWGAVAIAGGVVVTLGAAGGASWWRRTRP